MICYQVFWVEYVRYLTCTSQDTQYQYPRLKLLISLFLLTEKTKKELFIISLNFVRPAYSVELFL